MNLINYKYDAKLDISFNELIRGDYDSILSYFNIIKKDRHTMNINEISELPTIPIENQLLELKNNNKEYGQIFVLKKVSENDFFVTPIYVRINKININNEIKEIQKTHKKEI